MFTAEILDQLREILRVDFGAEYTREEADSLARDLIGFFEFLTKEEKK